MRNIDRQAIRRISQSPLSLTLVAPATRPIATGTAPGTAPLNPLTGDTPTTGMVTTDPTPYATTVSMPCLWNDIAARLSDMPPQERDVQRLGWVENATAVARVLVSDAAIDPDNPYGPTKFKQADYVLYNERRYDVLEVTPMGSGSALPVSYYVWLAGK